jgi:hypothetical protein
MASEVRASELTDHSSFSQRDERESSQTSASTTSSRSSRKSKDSRRKFEINTEFKKMDSKRTFMDNRISTGRYNCASFLPKNLFE